MWLSSSRIKSKGREIRCWRFIYRSTAAALADLSFFDRRNYNRVRLILVGDVLLLALETVRISPLETPANELVWTYDAYEASTQ